MSKFSLQPDIRRFLATLCLPGCCLANKNVADTHSVFPIPPSQVSHPRLLHRFVKCLHVRSGRAESATVVIVEIARPSCVVWALSLLVCVGCPAIVIRRRYADSRARCEIGTYSVLFGGRAARTEEESHYETRGNRLTRQLSVRWL